MLHTGQAPYKCSFCDQRFIRPFMLKGQSGVRGDGCMARGAGEGGCGVTPGQQERGPGDGAGREMLHTGQAPYKCSFCDQRFIRPFMLKGKSHVMGCIILARKPFLCNYAFSI